MESLTWIAIAICLSQSAIFSGLNLALLGISRLRLEAEAESGSRDAARVLDLRRNSHYLLTTILWGNVSVNCLLTLLSDSVLAGVAAFVFSTFGITLGGEILPQAYFSRNALRVGARLAPLVKGYQLVLYPLARPTALLLDWWLGTEGITFFRERDLREIIRIHKDSDEAEVGHVEGTGALNFLALDDLPIGREGELVDGASVIALPQTDDGSPILPRISRDPTDPFLSRIAASGKKWVILTNSSGEPQRVLDADGFLRDCLFGRELTPELHLHQPLVVSDPETRLGSLLRRLRVEPVDSEDDVIDRDVVLLWAPGERRVVTGADLLGRLMRGIALRLPPLPESVGAAH